MTATQIIRPGRSFFRKGRLQRRGGSRAIHTSTAIRLVDRHGSGPVPSTDPDAPRDAGQIEHTPAKNPQPVLVAGLGAASVMFFIFFRTGKFLASGDVAPLVVDGLRHELGWQWTHQTTGAGGPTYEIARTAEVAAVQLSRLFGGGEAMGQRLLYSFIWGFAAAAGAALAIRFTNRKWLATILGLVAVLNPYTLIAQPNPLPIVAIAIACAITALCSDASRGQSRRWVMLSLLTFPCSYLSLNPPLLVLIVAFSLAQVIVTPFLAGGGLAGARRIVSLVARAAPLSAALSAWWAVPAFIAIQKADPTAVGAVTNVQAWAWTHQRSSIANVLTMFGHWSWPRTEYYGGAVVLESFPWNILRWVLPLGALLAPFLVRKVQRPRATFVAVLIVISALVGKGLHKPFSGVNRWMYAHVPGFWLFREPAAKVGVVLIVLYTIAFTMAVDEVVQRLENRLRVGKSEYFNANRTRTKRIQTTLIGLVAMAPLLGVWPLWTGTIVKAASSDEVGDRSALPAEWRHVAKTINTSPLRGKTLVLPIDDYYQVPTTWGYYGADNLVRRLIRRPVLQSDPQLYVGDSDVFEALMKTVEKSIVLNDGQGTASLLRALGVSHIVVRNDIDFSSKKRKLNMQKPETIRAGLRHVDGLRLMQSTNVADVFELTDRPGSAVEVLGGIVQAGKLPPVGLAMLRSALPDGLALASTTPFPELAAGRAIVQQGTSPTGKVDLGIYGSWLVSRHAEASPTYRLTVGTDGMRAEGIIKWKISGTTPLPGSTIDYLMPGLAGIQVGSRLLDMWSPPTVIRLDAATTGTPWIRRGDGTNLGTRSNVLDCNNHNAATREQLGITAREVLDLYGSRIELHAKRHSACVRYPITGVKPGNTFHVRIQGRSLGGSVPRFCIWVHGPNQCAQIETLTKNDAGEFATSAIWQVPDGATSADLYLYADESASGTPTVIQYHRPIIDQIDRAAPIALRPAPLPPIEVRLPSGVQKIGATLDAQTPKVGAIGPLGDCNRTNNDGFKATGLSRTLIPKGVRLEARDHAACIRIPFENLTSSLPYVVSFEHRSIRGEHARYCILDRATGQCVASSRLESSNVEWTVEHVNVDAPVHSMPEALSLYLYADGSPRTGTRTEYRNITIRPFVDEYLALLSAGTVGRSAPPMTFKQISPARYRVRVSEVIAPFVLALSDSWSKDWRVSGAPKDAKIDHLLIDGYRNGWALDAHGDLNLLLEYVPARAGQLAIRLSVLAVLLTAAIAVIEIRRRRSSRFTVEPIFDLGLMNAFLRNYQPLSRLSEEEPPRSASSRG